MKRNVFWLIIGVFITAFLVFIQIKFGVFYATNVLSEGFVGTYQNHDLPVEVLSLVSQGLVKIDGNGRVQPNLVSNWESNKEATDFKFKLKDNLKWSDGTTIKSNDLEFAIPDASVSYPDDKTIEFKLKDTYSPFPSLLTKPVLKRGNLIGTGPYVITKIEKSRIFITKITLKSSNLNLPIVYIRFYPSEKVAINGFLLGEISSLFGVSNVKSLPYNPQIKVKQKTDYSKIVTIVYNFQDPFLGKSNRSLRQALSFIAPKIEDEEAANSPYPPFLWAYNSESKKYLANEKDAKAALERAKSTLSEDKLKGELVLTATPNLEQVGNRVVDEWRKLGFNAKVRVESGIPQNFQAVVITQTIPSDPDQYLLWHTSADKTNLSKYSFARVDKDLEDGRSFTVEEDRKNKYFDFQKALLEDAPATFLYFPKYNIVYLRKSENLLQKVLDLQLPKS